jgi:predicted transcriptional regulator
MTRTRSRKERDAANLRRAKIVAWVARFPGATVGDVARVFNLPREAAKGLLNSAADRHELMRERNRYWPPPADADAPG